MLHDDFYTQLELDVKEMNDLNTFENIDLTIVLEDVLSLVYTNKHNTVYFNVTPTKITGSFFKHLTLTMVLLGDKFTPQSETVEQVGTYSDQKMC